MKSPVTSAIASASVAACEDVYEWGAVESWAGGVDASYVVCYSYYCDAGVDDCDGYVVEVEFCDASCVCSDDDCEYDYVE